MDHPALPLLDEPYPLTDEHVAAYRRDGFVQVDDVVTGETLAAMREAVVAAVEAESMGDDAAADGIYARIFNQKVNLWARHPSVAPFTLSRRLGDVAARLAGTDVRVWHDQALFKAPHQDPGNPTPWHQDAPYWPHGDRRRSLSIWIALRDATPENGCMTFVPGTHEAGELDAVDLGKGHLQRPNLLELAPAFKGTKAQLRPLKAGSATFHNGLTFHYAGANRSEATREAFVVIYTPADQTFSGDPGHGITDPLNLKPGDRLPDATFPVVGRA